MSILPPDAIAELRQEYYILHLLYHRNKNQHRVAVWWRSLSQVHRHLRQLLLKIQEHEDTIKHRIKDRLKKEAVAIARHLYYKVCPSAYYAFNGVIALGHFVSLGLVLVACLGKIHSLVGKVENLNDVAARPAAAAPAVEASDDFDLGEEVEPSEPPRPVAPPKRQFDDIESIFGPSKKKDKEPKKKQHKKEKKPKKKKNAMDDIFG